MNQNLITLFDAMATDFEPVLINPQSCGCTELQILQAINQNIVNFGQVYTGGGGAGNPGGSDGDLQVNSGGSAFAGLSPGTDGEVAVSQGGAWTVGAGGGDATVSGDNVWTGDNTYALTTKLTQVDLGVATELGIDVLNVNEIAADKTFTFASGITLYRPFYLRLQNTDVAEITITLTPPGGTTLFSVERGSAITEFAVGAGQTVYLTFLPITSSLIEIFGIPPPLNWVEEFQLTHPHQVDGTGAAMNLTSSSALYGHATFSNSADQAANYVIYRMAVPHDFDPSVDLEASFSFRLGGADTGKHRYVISMADVDNSASSDAPTFSNAINLDFAGDASGASGDRETIDWTVLTGWRTSLTAGHSLVIKVARDGDDGTNDTSTVNSSDLNLKIKMGHTQ